MKVVGVYPIQADEPCHLVEVVLPDSADFDWGQVTQPDTARPRDDWQVAYDEQVVDERDGRWAFFFHYLNVEEPLWTPRGPVRLPLPSPLPSRLVHLQYEPPS